MALFINSAAAEKKGTLNVSLNKSEIDNIIKGQNIFLNLKNKQIFPSNLENFRIAEIIVHKHGPSLSNNNSVLATTMFNVKVEHPGIGIIKKDNVDYIFSKMNKSANPSWGTNSDLRDGTCKAIEVSPKTLAMLSMLFDNHSTNGSESEASKMASAYYAFPPALSEIKISSTVAKDSLRYQITITGITIEIEYTYN